MNYRTYRKRLFILMAALMLNAILGFALSTFINFDPAKHNTTQSIVLGLHIIIAVGIIIGGIIQLISSVRSHIFRTLAMVGLLGSFVAFITGGMSADNGNAIAVFIMALCFIVSLGAYGYSLTNLSKIEKA